MAFEQKDNSFTLFENDKKGNEKAPTLKGKGMIGGKEVKIAVWKKTGKTGVEYWSGTIEEVLKIEPEPVKEEQPTQEVLDDSIPF